MSDENKKDDDKEGRIINALVIIAMLLCVWKCVSINHNTVMLQLQQCLEAKPELRQEWQRIKEIEISGRNKREKRQKRKIKDELKKQLLEKCEIDEVLKEFIL